ncbi:MAG TPA: APC family permease [Streptosporangiaceae bacterium]|nr:APC family permease [Streptosporangiaceae bacterium]
MASEQAGSSYERLATHHKLKLPDAVAQSIGFMGPVFSIAFLVPLLVGVNAASQGAGGAAPLAVLVAAIGILGLGWIVSEYAKRIHAAGSLYDYVTDGLGATVGAAAGWLYYSGIIVLGGAILVLISGYIHDTLQAEFNVTPLPVGGWMIVLIVIISAILYAGVQLSTRIQLILALLSLTLLTIFFVYIIAKVGSGNSVKAFQPSSSPTHFTGVLFGVLYGVLLFVGFETAANLGEETEHPKRDIPRAVLFAVIAATVFYLIASYAQVAGFHFELSRITKAASGPLFVLAGPGSQGGYGSVAIRRLAELLVLLDMLAVLIGISVSGPRGLFAMARDRRLPAFLASVSRKRGTPLGAAIFVVAFYAVFALITVTWTGLFALPQTPHYSAMFSWGSTFGSFALALIYLLLAVGALRGLRDHPRRWAVVLAVVVSVLVTGGAVFGSIYKVTAPTVIAPYAAIGWLAVGLVVAALVRGRPQASHAVADLAESPESALGRPASS